MTSPWDIPGLTERLIELHTQGLFFSEIAEGLNAEYATCLTRNACIGQVHRLGLPNRPSLAKPKPPVTCDPVPIEQLDNDNCHYPLGETEDRPPYRYCGMPARQGASWCAKHYRKVYVRTASRWA